MIFIAISVMFLLIVAQVVKSFGKAQGILFDSGGIQSQFNLN